jgi:hypothetical protein
LFSWEGGMATDEDVEGRINWKGTKHDVVNV